jgi:hypothetical protein
LNSFLGQTMEVDKSVKPPDPKVPDRPRGKPGPKPKGVHQTPAQRQGHKDEASRIELELAECSDIDVDGPRVFAMNRYMHNKALGKETRSNRVKMFRFFARHFEAVKGFLSEDVRENFQLAIDPTDELVVHSIAAPTSNDATAGAVTATAMAAAAGAPAVGDEGEDDESALLKRFDPVPRDLQCRCHIKKCPNCRNCEKRHCICTGGPNSDGRMDYVVEEMPKVKQRGYFLGYGWKEDEDIRRIFNKQPSSILGSLLPYQVMGSLHVLDSVASCLSSRLAFSYSVVHQDPNAAKYILC